MFFTSRAFIILFLTATCNSLLNNVARSYRSSIALSLFNWGAPKKQPAAKVDEAKLEQLKAGLEKVSRTQGNRDYDAEFLSREKEALARAKEIKDRQVQSFNFNRANEFPNLYKGWIKKEGDQIAKQMISSVKAAISAKEKYVEILFDPVPNLDEVAVGTAFNKLLRLEVAENLKVPEYATNRGGPAVLEWSNIYWANRLAAGVTIGKGRILVLTISGEGTKAKGMSLQRLQDVKRPGVLNKGDWDCVIILSPCQENHYMDAKKLGDQLDVPVIALNAPYSYKYDIGGAKEFDLSYVMKRIPKGWIYRQYGKPFEAIIEGPNYEVFRAGTFATRPSLPEISKLSMAASAQKYGAIGNDRIFANRL